MVVTGAVTMEMGGVVEVADRGEKRMSRLAAPASWSARRGRCFVGGI